MVKFSRQLEAQLIPEWKDAFVNYRQLKKHVKKIKLAFMQSSLPLSDEASSPNSIGISILKPLRNLVHRSLNSSRQENDDEENLYETELIQSREDAVREFFEKLDDELVKVNGFYRTKESEFCERAEILNKQLQILIDLKKILDEHRRRRRLLQQRVVNSSRSSDLFGRLSHSSSFSETSCDEAPTPTEGSNSPIAEEIIAALERNGVSFVGSAQNKAKKGQKPRMTTMRIDIPATDATKTIAAVTSVIWEDIVNGQRKEGANGNNGDYINRKKIQCAEKMIRGAFLELYKGLNHLKNYSDLNMVAFTKIMKKFHKVSNKRDTGIFLQKVKRSYFISSDKVVRLIDEVESVFTKQFASNDRKKAMKFLRPQQPKDSHMITFLVGLFTGSFVALFSVYAILAHISGIFSSWSSQSGYIEIVYPVFSMFALLSLHIFLYGCNLLMWKSKRINQNFIFDFSPSTALKHRDAFLICTSFMTIVVAAMVTQLVLKSSDFFARNHADALPGTLLLMFIFVLICPFNVLYRSTRYCFLRVMRNIIFTPFYKVVMVDFFMADQLTSQIPLLKHMEFTSCYFVASLMKSDPYETCSTSKQYKLLAYVISFLPYYCRAMQCVRRYIEEDYDLNHLANAGKYVSAMLAAAVRWKYAIDPTPFWLVVVIFVSAGATIYQLYWDFVKDWGLFDLKSKNFCLRDDLVIKNKNIYYASMVINFVLRLTWIENISRINLGPIENRMIDFLIASMEITRRGHWNFYRLENEHLNNVGKFRAVKTVPLPFRDIESDD